MENTTICYLILSICRRGGDVVVHHNKLCFVFLSFCHQAHITAPLEAGSGLTPGRNDSRPADVLVRDWALGMLAAFDITVVAAEAAKRRNHVSKCAKLAGYVCL